MKRVLRSLELFLPEKKFIIPYTPDPYWAMWSPTFTVSEKPNKVKRQLFRLDTTLTQYDWREVIKSKYREFFSKGVCLKDLKEIFQISYHTSDITYITIKTPFLRKSRPRQSPYRMQKLRIFSKTTQVVVKPFQPRTNNTKMFLFPSYIMVNVSRTLKKSPFLV